MIERGFFNEQVTRALSLGGHFKPTEDFLGWLYEELKEESSSDFVRACNESANSSLKVTLQQMKDFIGRYKRERIMEEARKHSQRRHGVEKVAVCNFGRRCDRCKVEYCDVVANYAFSNIRRVLDKELSLSDALSNLSVEFPGLGYERQLEKFVHHVGNEASRLPFDKTD
ncbi:MAG: hypothetical protein SFH39_12175 [Candidatus Magnetobacterium sp. LHC-1]|nr:hypothetical protein [Nitrospirota bacterium]